MNMTLSQRELDFQVEQELGSQLGTRQSSEEEEWNSSNEKQVMLKELDFDASGLYSCEVSTETPIYTKPSDDLEMTVMQAQLEDPHISFGKLTYMVGEMLQINCTSGSARPTPDVTWLINGLQAHESWMKMFPEESPNSVTVQLGLKIEDIYESGLRLTCISTIPAFLGHHARHSLYADHKERTLDITVIGQVTQPPTVIQITNHCGSGQKRLSLSDLLFSAILLAVTAQCYLPDDMVEASLKGQRLSTYTLSVDKNKKCKSSLAEEEKNLCKQRILTDGN
ncbi:hypothetical protein GE061_019369 [Apolygus lucorum]|uniref:Ig-like domain-containing protein n=1 Tax=Apolygus lucorum TaxID=248454 RepID=A0A8S9X890_APOLU|nr:hypothetical protein GE061_019369 [Apolygus lucorum]